MRKVRADACKSVVGLMVLGTHTKSMILPLAREDFRKEAMIQKRPRVEGRFKREGRDIYT